VAQHQCFKAINYQTLTYKTERLVSKNASKQAYMNECQALSQASYQLSVCAIRLHLAWNNIAFTWHSCCLWCSDNWPCTFSRIRTNYV